MTVPQKNAMTTPMMMPIPLVFVQKGSSMQDTADLMLKSGDGGIEFVIVGINEANEDNGEDGFGDIGFAVIEVASY